MGNQRVDITQAQLPELVAAVEAGEEVMITRDGQPVARLLPAQTTMAVVPMKRPRKAGSARGLFRVPDDFDAPLDFRDFV